MERYVDAMPRFLIEYETKGRRCYTVDASDRDEAIKMTCEDMEPDFDEEVDAELVSAEEIETDQ